MNSTAVGVDIAKNVFQVHYVDQESGEMVNKVPRATTPRGN
jgi:transposase